MNQPLLGLTLTLYLSSLTVSLQGWGVRVGKDHISVDHPRKPPDLTRCAPNVRYYGMKSLVDLGSSPHSATYYTWGLTLNYKQRRLYFLIYTLRL